MDPASKEVTQLARTHARGTKPSNGIERPPSRHRMLWTACGLVVFAIALFQVYDVIRRHEIVIETAERHFSSLVRSLAEQSAVAVRAVDLLLRSVAYDAGRAQPIKVDLQHWLQLEPGSIPELQGLAVLNANAAIVTGIGNFSVATQPDAADYFSVHRERKVGGLYISKPLLDTGGVRHTVALSRRIDGPEATSLASRRLSWTSNTFNVSMPPWRLDRNRAQAAAR